MYFVDLVLLPLFRQHSLSQSSCVSPVELPDGGLGMEGERSKIIRRRRESPDPLYSKYSLEKVIQYMSIAFLQREGGRG
jgi:hypothetical protein